MASSSFDGMHIPSWFEKGAYTDQGGGAGRASAGGSGASVEGDGRRRAEEHEHETTGVDHDV